MQTIKRDQSVIYYSSSNRGVVVISKKSGSDPSGGGGGSGGLGDMYEIDCTDNPLFPKASKGDTYLVTYPGRIGGDNGLIVKKGDILIAIQDTPGGDYIKCGDHWTLIPKTQPSYEASGDVVGPDTSIPQAIAIFNGTTGKLLADSRVKITTNEIRPVETADNYTIPTELAIALALKKLEDSGWGGGGSTKYPKKPAEIPMDGPSGITTSTFPAGSYITSLIFNITEPYSPDSIIRFTCGNETMIAIDNTMVDFTTPSTILFRFMHRLSHECRIEYNIVNYTTGKANVLIDVASDVNNIAYARSTLELYAYNATSTSPSPITRNSYLFEFNLDISTGFNETAELNFKLNGATTLLHLDNSICDLTQVGTMMITTNIMVPDDGEITLEIANYEKGSVTALIDVATKINTTDEPRNMLYIDLTSGTKATNIVLKANTTINTMAVIVTQAFNHDAVIHFKVGETEILSMPMTEYDLTDTVSVLISLYKKINSTEPLSFTVDNYITGKCSFIIDTATETVS